MTLLKSKSAIALLAYMVFLLSACSQQNIQQYSDQKPEINIQTFFDGKLKAYGVVKNRQGDVIRHFTADITASWQDGVATLDEHFIFSDGEKTQRIWTLKPNGNGKFLASANDVVGESDMLVAGNAIFMEYILQLPYKEGILDVTVDDKMFLVDKNKIINESIFTKWGFRVATVQLVIEKTNGAETATTRRRPATTLAFVREAKYSY
ncbi:hypothetical protein SIN8267_01335 [Sinobacterium norvegicum]|uniref:DUF3833 domain-containing protein n=1 Tax=Sinobacterium norvegicum TaxID=1641715 RepID=A0ABM9ADG5_9GAMM|nr:DUF3833 domain-containing protein [Sinobacterium norvegicum]CAH0991233.1 hypothetical protein SIN8267_01335 [Sinobacterium norvegicum]